MNYVITITRTERLETTRRGEHTIIDERPWTVAEIDDNTRYGESNEEFLKRAPLKHIYGYAPHYQGFETKETEVLKQTVDTLDLAAVIKAINGLT